MDKGTKADELYASQDTRVVTIVYKDKEWDFTVRDLTWKQKGDCITAGMKVAIEGKGKTKHMTMDGPAYNIAYMMKAIVKAPFPVNMASFMKLDSDFGDLLVDAIVNVETDNGEDLGNSNEPSEA